jgi:hypothetical protein
MPQRTHSKSLLHTLFLAAALSLLSAVVRRERRQLLKTARDRRKKVRVAPRRIAASVAFATLFFAGAAFSAGAGNTVVALIDPTSSDSAADTTTTTTTTTADENQSSEAAPSESHTAAALLAASASASGSAQSSESQAQGHVSQAVAADHTNRSQAQSTSSSRVGASFAKSASARAGSRARVGGKTVVQTSHALRLQGPPVIKAQPQPLRKPVDREPEADEPNVAATVWLYRDLPDPTPPSRRLKPSFARQLMRVSKRNHVDWALTLAVLRADGQLGTVPASKARLMELTQKLARRHSNRDAWASVLSIEGRTGFADRTVALQNLYRALGLQTLVHGYDWAKPRLEKQVLNDKRISIYPGGRSDIQRHRVNVRVLALLAYLAEAHGQVTVSCLLTGHGLYARPGVVSAHIYGEAVDISALGGVSIYGNQQPGGVTEKAVRNILLLPVELRPKQVISLLGMGGPSFALADHYDHIHVGY